MPILAPTLDKAVRNLSDHLNALLVKTITQRRLVSLSNENRVLLTFRQAGGPVPAQLKTKFGVMRLAVGQICEGVREDGQVRLATVEYRYALSRGFDPEPLLRWEYVRKWPDAGSRWCRHHLQGNVTLSLGDGISMNDMHLPTGYTTVEEVIRFCIVDLGVKPLSSKWHSHLEESYRLFKDYAGMSRARSQAAQERA